MNANILFVFFNLSVASKPLVEGRGPNKSPHKTHARAIAWTRAQQEGPTKVLQMRWLGKKEREQAREREREMEGVGECEGERGMEGEMEGGVEGKREAADSERQQLQQARTKPC